MDIKFCPKCDSYLRFKRLPEGKGYWVCSSCSYSEGAPPPSELIQIAPPKRVQNRNAPRKSRVMQEDGPSEDYNPLQVRLREIILHATPPITAAQIQSLIDRDFIQSFRGQYRLTPAGQLAFHNSQQGVKLLTPDEVGFCRLLVHSPLPEDLHALEAQGLITIKEGQPLLTPKGETLRVKLQEQYDRKVQESKELSDRTGGYPI